MSEIARGDLATQSLPRLYSWLTAKKTTGTLRFDAAGRRYEVGFRDGAVVWAKSPNPGDSFARMAIKTGSVTQAQVQSMLIAAKSDPTRTQQEILQQLANLPPDTVRALERRALANSATRPFALDAGTFAVSDDVPPLQMQPVASHWLIYHGLRQYFTLDRLRRELGDLGTHSLRLTPAGERMLDMFGFQPAEKPILELLRSSGVTVRALVEKLPAMAPQHLLAVIAALYSTGCLGNPKSSETSAPTTVAPPTTVPAAVPAAASIAPPSASPRAAKKKSRRSKAELRTFIQGKVLLVRNGADHFALLGVQTGASDRDVTTAYIQIARTMHPDKVRAADLDIDPKNSQRAFARINVAFAELTNPKKRAHYMEVLAAGGEAAWRRLQDEASATAGRILAAEEHFHIGEMALRRNQFRAAREQFQKAVDLNPQEAEYLSKLGWATWTVATDKQEVTSAVLTLLGKALLLDQKCVPAYFYLGQIDKFRGDQASAKQHFQKVLSLDKTHGDAQLELRLIKGRS